MDPDWPQTVPADLRPRLEEVLSYRSHGAAEVWGAVREWLVAHEVDAPDLPPDDLPSREWRWPA